MAQANSSNELVTVIITFDVAEEEQAILCGLLKTYIDDFVSHQEGFACAQIHQSICGKRVVNYTQWQSLTHHKAFTEKAKTHAELPRLLSYQPQTSFYTAAYGIDAGSH